MMMMQQPIPAEAANPVRDLNLDADGSFWNGTVFCLMGSLLLLFGLRNLGDLIYVFQNWSNVGNKKG